MQQILRLTARRPCFQADGNGWVRGKRHGEHTAFTLPEWAPSGEHWHNLSQTHPQNADLADLLEFYRRAQQTAASPIPLPALPPHPAEPVLPLGYTCSPVGCLGGEKE